MDNVLFLEPLVQLYRCTPDLSERLIRIFSSEVEATFTVKTLSTADESVE
jgi:hypothetical protein